MIRNRKLLAVTGTVAGVGDWEYSFPASPDPRAVDCTNPSEYRRYIIAKGWSPSRTATRSPTALMRSPLRGSSAGSVSRRRLSERRMRGVGMSAACSA